VAGLSLRQTCDWQGPWQDLDVDLRWPVLFLPGTMALVAPACSANQNNLVNSDASDDGSPHAGDDYDPCYSPTCSAADIAACGTPCCFCDSPPCCIDNVDASVCPTTCGPVPVSGPDVTLDGSSAGEASGDALTEVQSYGPVDATGASDAPETGTESGSE
jgi:hypothetical protein